jgi:hypothetical protein
MKKSSSADFHDSRWVVIYFFCLGLSFLFIEIAFIQKFILFLRNPLYAVGVIVSGFLLFAGLGSGCCSGIQNSSRLPKHPLSVSVAFIIAIVLVYLPLLPIVFKKLLWIPDPAKILVTLCLIAPLAFCMGMPFPLGLSCLSTRCPQLIPWAWGINGCASVISAVLATLLATHIGFSGIIFSAVFLYLIAALVYPSKTDSMNQFSSEQS